MPRICKILVVESHDGVRALLGEALAGEGYDIRLAGDGAAMRSALDAAKRDVVIVDVSSSSDDGFALAEEAAKSGASVILTTGDHAQFATVEKSGHHYVLKPFMMPELLALVRQVAAGLHCARRKARRRPG